ncbi:type IV pilin protein [Acinetobacter pseudolwoffii]|uniref:type IV pilin protein n=1 Tax=Acinetobacter pseudolwoffii TaxID=2053287 RepID=UPI00398A40D1
MVTVKGFTLLEVILVITIIGILAAIIYPSYQESVRKVKRTEAQAEMINIAKRLQRYRVANFSYLTDTVAEDEDGEEIETEKAIQLSDIQHTGSLPQHGEALYSLELIITGRTSWFLRAIPETNTIMSNNGQVCLNHKGYKYWKKGANCSANDLTMSSNWDGR